MAQDTGETKEGSTRKARARASEAIEQGVADAKEAAAEAAPVVTDYVAKALYGTCYYSAYAVTFSALLLGKLIPSESAMARGLHDGAESATREFKVYEEQRARHAAAESGTAESAPVRLEASAAQPS